MAESVELQLSVQLDESEVTPSLGESVTYGSSALLSHAFDFPVPAGATNLQLSLANKGTIQNIILFAPDNVNNSIRVKIDSTGNQHFHPNPIYETCGLTSAAPTNLYFTNTDATNAYTVKIQVISV